MRTSSRAVSVLVLLAVGASACGGSSTPTTTAPPNPATAQASIAKTYNALFNFTNKSVQAKEALIQGGSALTEGITDAQTSSLSSGIGGAQVTSATLMTGASCTTEKVSSPCAAVDYSITSTENTVLYAGQKGYAVYVAGKWLMAKVTICNLLDLFWGAEGKKGSPPGC